MAKTIADLTHKQEKVVTGNDNVVMPVVYETIENGRSLDVSDFTGSHIFGGHLIIKKTGEALYKPMPLNEGGTAYGELPEGYNYAGFQYGTITKEAPLGAISARCIYVTDSAPYPIDTLLVAVKAVLPLITFKTKED